MKKRYFITGTDTDAGKTFITVGLLAAATRAGLNGLGLKPIAAGAELIEGKLRNSDALQIQAASSVKLAYEQVNPVVFAAAIAPHIASAQAQRLITVSRLEGYVKGALLCPHNLALVEGAGGWKVPLNDRELLSDLAKSLGLPVILVVNMKLGCINHALLSADAIIKDGLSLAGWIANSTGEPMSMYADNLATLVNLLPAPLLGEVPWQSDLSMSHGVFDRILLEVNDLPSI